ncbi:unnamed protein product, partial [Prorocentrum cordatum]
AVIGAAAELVAVLGGSTLAKGAADDVLRRLKDWFVCNRAAVHPAPASEHESDNSGFVSLVTDSDRYYLAPNEKINENTVDMEIEEPLEMGGSVSGPTIFDVTGDVEDEFRSECPGVSSGTSRNSSEDSFDADGEGYGFPEAQEHPMGAGKGKAQELATPMSAVPCALQDDGASTSARSQQSVRKPFFVDQLAHSIVKRSLPLEYKHFNVEAVGRDLIIAYLESRDASHARIFYGLEVSLLKAARRHLRLSQAPELLPR